MKTTEHSEPDKPLAVPLSDQLGLAVAAAGCPPADYVAPGIVPSPVGRMYTQAELEAALAAERERWMGAVSWALGTNGHFNPPSSIGPYWWRSELAERCGIAWDGERWVNKA